MTGLVRKATLLALCGICVAGVARSAVPDPAFSTKPSVILWGGTASGVVDSRVQHTWIIRDNLNNPIQNSTVVIDFTTCTSSDYRLCSTQPFGGLTISCPNHSVSAITDITGTAVFRIVGGNTNNGGNPAGISSTTGCATVKVDGVNFGAYKTATYDENNSLGVNPADVSSFYSDRFGSYRQRSDFDATGTVTPADGSLILAVRFGGGSTASCSGGSCP